MFKDAAINIWRDRPWKPGLRARHRAIGNSRRLPFAIRILVIVSVSHFRGLKNLKSKEKSTSWLEKLEDCHDRKKEVDSLYYTILSATSKYIFASRHWVNETLKYITHTHIRHTYTKEFSMISVQILWRAIRSRGNAFKVENLQKKICWKKKNSLNESSTDIEADPTWSVARRIERKRRVSKARTGSQGDFSWWENSKKSWRQAVVSRTKEELIFNPLPNPSFRFALQHDSFSAFCSPRLKTSDSPRSFWRNRNDKSLGTIAWRASKCSEHSFLFRAGDIFRSKTIP